MFHSLYLLPHIRSGFPNAVSSWWQRGIFPKTRSNDRINWLIYDLEDYKELPGMHYEASHTLMTLYL